MTLQNLLNLVQAQDATQVNKGRLPWTAARLRSHPTVSLLMGGKDGNRAMRYDAGYEIRESFDGVVETDFGPAAMGSDYTWNATGEMAFMSRPYREYRWSESIFKHEIAFQGGSYSSAAHSRALWNILDKKNRNFDLGPIDKLESDWLWRTPDAAMEDKGTAASPIVSIPSVINEWRTADMGATAIAGDGVPPGFVAQQDLDPSDFQDPNVSGQSLAANRLIRYTEGASGVTGSGNTTVAEGHILEQLSLACRLTNYEQVPMVGTDAGGGMVPGLRAILCTEEGYTFMEQTVRAHGGDQFRIVTPGAKDTVTFSDFPLLPVPALTGKKLYPNYGNADPAGVAMVEERDAAGYSGPRFYLINSDGADLFFHNEGYWDVQDWYALDQINPDKIVKHGRNWWNLMFRDFTSHAIVAPGQDIARFATV